jgi:hypothetical protein
VEKGEVKEFPLHDLTPPLAILGPRIELSIEKQFKTALASHLGWGQRPLTARNVFLAFVRTIR